MKPTKNQGSRALLIAGVLCIAASRAMSAESGTLLAEVRKTDALRTTHGAANVQVRMAQDFSAFAGSQENAQNLFTGLRNGTPITLSSTATTSGSTASTTLLTFEPLTRPMGNGNAYISLALAKQQLASYGITDPTPQQIQAALTGGTIISGDATAQPVVLKGILTQRADGMGWGQIAKSSGMNLGQVISGLKSNNARIATGSLRNTGNGITTATGAAIQTNTDSNTGGSATTPVRGKSADVHGRGVVNATGSALGAGVHVNAGARAGGAGAGIVTGNGVIGSARGGASMQGQAKGLLKH